ncbi:MAG: tetratricopeptide repeat protein [Deltaproteobacteria bacterium]|nr:tetratricopeptide repeat protein [Deltaproteobacteria bacterium]
MGQGLFFLEYSLPRGERSRLLLLTESDIKEEDLQESRPIAPGWMGSPPARVAPTGTEGTLPAEPEGESAAPLGELGVGDEALPSVQGEERPAVALSQEAFSILVGEPSLLAKITPETTPRRAASLRLTEEGRRLLGSGEYQKALEQFEKTIAVDSTNPYSHYYLARAHHRLSNYRESLNFLDVAESLRCGEGYWLAQVFAVKGKNFQILGSFERADASYAHALKIDPNNQDAFEAITRIEFNQAGPLK